MKLSKLDCVIIGFTLFSMFFGAGNLIFPPFLGYLSGGKMWIAIIGFILSAVCLPILGVIAVAKAGSLNKIANKVHPKFAFIFIILIYLAIGPCLAIPRTASTSFEMAVIPFVSNVPTIMRFAYSFVFFALSFTLALHPEKLSDRLGKILCPILLVLILSLTIGCIVNPPPNAYGASSGVYTDNVVVQGFLDGYLTMDTLAALIFGIVISLNIQNKGIKEKSSIMKYTIISGIIAGIVLILVYSAIAHIGASATGIVSEVENGATVLTGMSSYLFGKTGSIILGVIFVIACFNTCTGLLCSCGEYFSITFPKISYKKWVIIFTISSLLISIAGLNMILKISVPVLNAIYPVAIILIILDIFNKFFDKYKYVYPTSIALTSIVSIIYALNSANIKIPFITDSILSIPPTADLCWLLPAIFGIIFGIILSFFNKNNVIKE